ncbi:MAG: ATP-binding cassette domain-containing protein, partial [Candidatus Eremiobacteraeota bacterium]|nr:ATP-binding cassette domain-containing protein [Candidatus Eremiobacteraeota bacterium]
MSADRARSIELLHLTKHYGERVVVNDVNAAVSVGEVVGLLGPNGAGKTTTFYMVVGLVRPDSGRVLLRDGTQDVELSDA